MEFSQNQEHENPYAVFPNEIWDQIIDRMQNTDDILNLFQVFPQLTSLSKGKQFSCLIGEVMPLIMPKYLFRNVNIFNCRLVSKKWKNAIETTLETHPERLPYKSISSQSKINENHFCYCTLPKVFTKIRKMLRVDFASMPQYRENVNPFLGRYLKIKVCVAEKRRIPTDILMRDILPLLENYGHHIHHIAFVLVSWDQFEENDLIRDTLCLILRSLSYFPNLKSFKLSADGLKRFVRNVGKSTINLNPESVPILSKLETVDLASFTGISVQTYHQLLTALVKHDQVKKLGIYHAYWNKKFGSSFPNLTELLFFDDGQGNAVEELCQVLHELQAPHLGKLQRNNGDNIFELLQVVAPYKIESLELVGYFPGDKNETGTRVLASSIKDLKMRVYVNQSYQFLQSLPSLQHVYFLHDHTDSDGYDSKETTYYDEIEPLKPLKDNWRNLGHYLLRSVARLDKLDFLWKSMPHLKMMTLRIDITTIQMAREYRNQIFELESDEWFVPPPHIFRHRYE